MPAPNEIIICLFALGAGLMDFRIGVENNVLEDGSERGDSDSSSN
jgi:hypothetical protein